MKNADDRRGFVISFLGQQLYNSIECCCWFVCLFVWLRVVVVVVVGGGVIIYGLIEMKGR